MTGLECGGIVIDRHRMIVLVAISGADVKFARQRIDRDPLELVVVQEGAHHIPRDLDMIRVHRLPVRHAVDGQGDHAGIRLTGAVGDLVLELLRNMLAVVEARLHGRVEIVGEASIGREMEGAEFTRHVGRLTLSGRNTRALDRAQEERARRPSRVIIGKHIAGHLASLAEGESVVDRNRARHPVNVELEVADIRVAGAVGDLVADRLRQRHSVEEADLGSLVQRIGVGAVGLDVKRAVFALNIGDCTIRLGKNPLAVEESKKHIA
ncbi:hypothetical protein ACVIGV_000010 [Rhizobium leguminosarum]